MTGKPVNFFSHENRLQLLESYHILSVTFIFIISIKIYLLFFKISPYAFFKISPYAFSR